MNRKGKGPRSDVASVVGKGLDGEAKGLTKILIHSTGFPETINLEV
jgi:hypothetical protein